MSQIFENMHISKTLVLWAVDNNTILLQEQVLLLPLLLCGVGVIFLSLQCHSKALLYTDDTLDPFKINFLVNQNLVTHGYDKNMYNKVSE